MPIIATVATEKFLSIIRNSFFRLGPKHSVTVTIWFSHIPLHRIRGIPMPTAISKLEKLFVLTSSQFIEKFRDNFGFFVMSCAGLCQRGK